MSEWKPGIFQTYPQAIQAILIGLTAAVIFIGGITWMFTHPTTVIQVYAWAFFGCLCVFTLSSWDSYSSAGEKVGKVALCLACLALAVRAVL